MAAPSGTVWGSIVQGSTSGRQGRIGVYTSVTNPSATTTQVNIQVWFWTIYSCEDGNNNFYCNIGTTTTAATTKIGSVNINHTVATGSGWNTSNQTRLYNVTNTYTRGTSAKTYKVYAKFNGIDMLSSKTMYINTSFTVPKLPTYTIKYNANGGSGVPANQTKTHGVNLTISSTKPTRTGYNFKGWSLTQNGSVYYTSGSSCGKNENLTLYAVWELKTYTITYNPNYTGGSTTSVTKNHGVNITLKTLTRTNYTFLGWSTSKTATAATYNGGASYSGNANVTLYGVWKLAYKKPSITSMSVARCDSSGTLSDEGTCARVSFSWACDKAVSSIEIEWISATNNGSETVTASGTSGTVTNKVVGANTLTTESTYTIKVTVTDEGGSTSLSKTLPGANFFIDLLDSNGTFGVAFGKPAERGGYIETAKPMVFNNTTSLYSIDIDGEPKMVFTGANNNGNTVIGHGNYTKKSGNTNIYGHDINIGVSNQPTPGYYRPYFRAGDSITFTLRTAGYVTNSGADVTFIVPCSLPIIGSPTITAASSSGFTLRQDGNYTHGSSATATTHPSSYTAASTRWTNGIYVTAKFTDLTNVVNNAPIGIVWSGTITFS